MHSIHSQWVNDGNHSSLNLLRSPVYNHYHDHYHGHHYNEPVLLFPSTCRIKKIEQPFPNLCIYIYYIIYIYILYNILVGFSTNGLFFARCWTKLPGGFDSFPGGRASGPVLGGMKKYKFHQIRATVFTFSFFLGLPYHIVM